MDGFHFDLTIKLSDVLLVGGGIMAFVKMFAGIRDSMKDLIRVVGNANPPSGLVGDVKVTQAQVGVHHDWLVEMRAKLGFSSH